MHELPGEDLVPRLNATSLQALQAELKEVDWRSQLQRSIEEHRYVQVNTYGMYVRMYVCMYVCMYV